MINLEALRAVQDRIELIILSTPIEWQDKQPGVTQWRLDQLKDIQTKRATICGESKETFINNLL